MPISMAQHQKSLTQLLQVVQERHFVAGSFAHTTALVLFNRL